MERAGLIARRRSEIDERRVMVELTRSGRDLESDVRAVTLAVTCAAEGAVDAPTLITETPADGRELAIMIARKTIATMQPDAEVRTALRPAYPNDGAQLIHAGEVVAIEFATIAAANNYWRD